MDHPSSTSISDRLYKNLRKSVLIKKYWQYLIMILVVALCMLLINQYLYVATAWEVRKDAQTELSLYGHAFASEFNQELGLLEGLRAFVSDKVQDELREDEFRAFASQLLVNTKSIRCVAAIPNGSHSFFYSLGPVGGALQEDLCSLRKVVVMYDSPQTLKTNQVIIGEPQKIRPEGVSLVPVQSLVYSGETLSGITSMVLDVEILMQESGLESLMETNRIALRDQQGVVFYGDATVFEEDPVRLMIPGHTTGWEIASIPKDGWANVLWTRIRFYVFLTVLISLLLLWIFHLIMSYQKDLSEAVQTRTEALRRSEHRYRTLVEQAADAILVLDTDAKILEVNASAQKLLGYSESELLGMQAQNIIDADDLAQKLLQVKLLEPDTSLRFERNLVHRDGHIIAVDGNVKTLPDGHLQAILRDVTEQKKATEALQKSETLFRVLAENAVDIVYRFRLKPEFSVDYISPSCVQIIGYTSQEIVESPKLLLREIHPEDRAIVEDIFSGQAQQMNLPVNLRWITEEGREIVTEHRVTYIQDSDGKVVALEGIARDITARVEAEHALVSSEDRFVKFFQASPDQIMITRLSDGMILECNHRFEEMMGFRCDEIVGKTTVELGFWSNGNLAREEFVEAILKTGVFHQRETIMKNRYGKSIPVSISSSLIEIDGDRCILAIIHNTMDISAAQSALAESESRYRSIFEDNSSVMLLIDSKTGEIVDANAAACRYYGYSKDELLSTKIFEINELPREKVLLEMEQARLERKRQFFFPHRLASGEIRHVEVYSGPIWVKGRQLLYSTIHDINDRVEREKEQAAILETAAALRVAENRETMIPIILDQVVKLVEAKVAGFFEPVGASQEGVRLELGRGIWEPYSGRVLPCINSRLYSAVQHGESVRIDDLASEIDRDISTCMFLEGINALVIKPLIANQEHIGTLFIGRENAFSGLEERLIVAIADMAANAIRRDSLFQDLQASTIELSRAYDVTLAGWAKALELRDKETEGHSQRVTEVTLQLARKMGFSDEELIHVRRGALLHDIGKMGIPDGILHKPGPLTEEEWAIMRLHPVYAYDLLKEVDFLAPALDIPYAHHEKWDGSGYPRGLKGEKIPLAARIFAIVDVWDALLSDRPYRIAWTEESTRAYLLEQAGIHFDPTVVQHFLEWLEEEKEQEKLGPLAKELFKSLLA